jgi:predicted metal-dependent phosphoesterase TrpH
MGVMEYDLHIHTSRYSGCSNIDPVEAMVRARDVGLRGIALTEHGIRWRDDEIQEVIREAGVQGLAVFPGQEIACYSTSGKFQGEFLVFGYPSSLGSNKSVETLIGMVHEKGGVVLAAHPFKRHDTGHGYYGSGDATSGYALDGLEVEHPAYDGEGRACAADLATKMGIAGIGCSDAHDIRSIGICRTVFESEVLDVQGLCVELKGRRVKALNSIHRECR